MSLEIICIYLYSTIAQTLGALIGLGIIVLTFQAQWSNNRRKELREHLRLLGSELAQKLGGPDVRYVGSDLTFIQRISDYVDELPDGDGRKNETKMCLRQYQGFKPVLSDRLFAVCLITSAITITGAVIGIFFLEYIWSWYPIAITGGFILSVVIYCILGFRVVRMLTRDIFH